MWNARTARPRRCLSHWMIAGLGLAWLTLLGACASTPATPVADEQADASVSEQLTLTLHTATANRRYTYFELDAQGVLWYGGGRDAAIYRARQAGQLTAQQRAALAEVVQKHDLLDGRDRPFAQAQQVTYQVKISQAGRNRSYRTIDDQVPGLRELHDLLFQYQVDLRYD